MMNSGQKLKFLPRSLLLIFGAFIALMLGLVFNSGKAAAFSTTTPIQSVAPASNSANVYGSPSNIQPWFAVGRGQYDGLQSEAKVYVPVGDTAKLTIVNGGGYIGCQEDVTTVGPEVVYELDSTDQTEVPSSPIYNGDNVSSGLSCHNITISIPARGSSSKSLRPGHGNYVVYYFKAQILNACGAINTCNSIKSYLLSVSVTSGANQSTPYVGLSRNALNPSKTYNDQTVFGLYEPGIGSPSSPSPTTWDYAVQFAPFCDENPSSGSTEVGVYDVDYHTFSQQANAGSLYPDYVKQDQNLTALIDTDNRANSTYNWSLAPPGGNSTQKTPGNGGWNSVAGVDHSSTDLPFNFNYKQRYLMEFRDVSYRNVIQIKLPFDQFDSLPSVGQACSPSYSCKTNPANTTAAINTWVTITVTATNTGNINWDPSTATYAMHKLVNGVDQGNLQVTNIVHPANNGPPPTTATFSFQAQAPATNNSTKIVNFVMFLNGAPMNGSGCNTVIQTGGGGGNFTFTLTCSSTYIQVQTVAREKYYTYSNVGGSYWTQSSPVDQAPDGQNYWTGSPPPTAIPQPVGASGNKWTDNNPLSPTFGQTFYLYGEMQFTNYWKPAHDVPIKVQWLDQNGNQVGSDYKFVFNANSSGWTTNPPMGTFATFNALRPHNVYTARLSADIAAGTTFTQNDESTYNYTVLAEKPLIAPNNQNTCLQAQANPANGNSPACQGGTSVDKEVGQQTNITYTVQLTNFTDISFSNQGYTLLFHFDGGLQPVGSTSSNLNVQNGGSPQSDPSGPIPVITNYQGDYWVEFQYNGVRVAGLPTDGWDATCPPVDTQAHSLPYFQVWNGDISAGGGFASPSGSADTKIVGSCSANYVAPGNQYVGDIRAFGNQNGKKGSEADFGVFAMGLDPGSTGGGSTGNLGFYSRDSVSGSRPYFANTTSPMYGYLNGSPPSHCQKDFFTDTQINPVNSSGDLGTDIAKCQPDSVTGLARCQYISNGLTINAATIPNHKQVTLYVDGDVTINGNISYDSAPFDANNPVNMPYFALVVRGNITLTQNVTHLDGLYVAQYRNASSPGEFSTCEYVCTNQLVVNGAVVAQHVELKRKHGTEDKPPNDVNGIGANPAEVFNYVPSMVIGAPAFGAIYGQSEGTFSLAPVF